MQIKPLKKMSKVLGLAEIKHPAMVSQLFVDHRYRALFFH